MLLLLLSTLLSPLLTVPLPQNLLTESQFRSVSSRSLSPGSNFVLISPSYRQVRRQGRKGETPLIKFPTLKVRDPNELNFPTTKIEQHEDSGPVFQNSNSLSTEDIESKIKEINESIEAESEAPHILESTKTEEILESLEELEVFTTLEPEEEIVSLNVDNESEEFIKEEFKQQEDIFEAPIKRIVVSIKSAKQNDNLDGNKIKEGLKTITELNTVVLTNELDEVIRTEFSQPGHLIFVDARIDIENGISGNVFSNSKPLEQLEGEDYEEALNILNKVSELLDKTIVNSDIEEEEPADVNKKIIVAIRTAVFITEQTTDKIKDSLEEVGTDVVVHINAPEEIIRQEFTPNILPIFVSISIDAEHLVGGNVYYNSVPLESLVEPEAEESYNILITVRQILEESIEIPTPVEVEQVQNTVTEEVSAQDTILTKKVVISLKSYLDIPDTESAQLSRQISRQVEIDSILLVNRPTDTIQAQLRGPAVPILLDINIDQELQIRGNIFYKYQPLEHLNGQEFDEAMKILTVVKNTLTEKINRVKQEQSVTDTETTITNNVDTTTALDLNTLVDTKINANSEVYFEDIEEATAEPSPEPEPTSPELSADTINQKSDQEISSVSQGLSLEDNYELG